MPVLRHACVSDSVARKDCCFALLFTSHRLVRSRLLWTLTSHPMIMLVNLYDSYLGKSTIRDYYAGRVTGIRDLPCGSLKYTKLLKGTWIQGVRPETGCVPLVTPPEDWIWSGNRGWLALFLMSHSIVENWARSLRTKVRWRDEHEALTTHWFKRWESHPFPKIHFSGRNGGLMLVCREVERRNLDEVKKGKLAPKGRCGFYSKISWSYEGCWPGKEAEQNYNKSIYLGS